MNPIHDESGSPSGGILGNHPLHLRSFCSFCSFVYLPIGLLNVGALRGGRGKLGLVFEVVSC